MTQNTILDVARSPYVVGIDLGTSNSAIAVYYKGQAETIPIEGLKMLPSAFTVRDKEIVIGEQAKRRLMIDPENTVVSIKREMGSDWKKEFSELPGEIYTPTRISSEILNGLIDGSSKAETIDWRGRPENAVICIPANFTDDQKVATKEAAELANLKVLHLLEEPVAAAIAYGLEKARDQTILVYDLGGGTFDVSILKVDSTQNSLSQFKVLAKEGISKLGGDDFDYKIMEIAAAKLAQDSGIDILNLNKDQGIKKKSLRQAQQKLKEKAEEVKKELSQVESATLLVPNIIKDESGQVYNLDLEIIRAEFNNAIQESIEQSKKAIQQAIDSVNSEDGEPFTVENIDRIILIGGSTRVPLIKEMLTEYFGKEPYSDSDPDTAVARGAAIYGHSIGGANPADPNELPPAIEIQQKVTHFLGIELAGGKFSCLIPKGQDIPIDRPLVCNRDDYTTPRDNLDELQILVYQAETEVEFIRQAEGIKCIGEFFLKGIPSKPAGKEKIEVTFEIDQQNLLKVKAKSSGSSEELEIQRS